MLLIAPSLLLRIVLQTKAAALPLNPPFNCGGGSGGRPCRAGPSPPPRPHRTDDGSFGVHAWVLRLRQRIRQQHVADGEFNIRRGRVRRPQWSCRGSGSRDSRPGAATGCTGRDDTGHRRAHGKGGGCSVRARTATVCTGTLLLHLLRHRSVPCPPRDLLPSRCRSVAPATEATLGTK